VKCKNHETKNEKLHELKFEDLQACGCERCQPAAEQKELDNLRAWKQQDDSEKAASQRAEQIAQEIIDKNKEVDDEIGTKVNDIVNQKLEENGVNLNNKYTRRLVEQKMHFDNKNVYASPAYGRQSLSPQMKSFVHWAKTGEAVDRKAMGGGTDIAGGYLVPEEFRAEVIRKLKPLTVVRRAGARAITMNSDTLDIPVVSANGSGSWIGENTTYAESEPTLDNVRLTPFKYARLVRASYEMMEDSAIDVANLLSDIFAEDFSAAEDAAFINGAGTDRPTGINQASLGSIAASSSLADDIVKLVYTLARQYRSGSAFMLRGEVIQLVRLLKDGNGRYLWQDGLQEGEPPRLLGYPVYESNDLPEYDLDGSGTGTAMGSDVLFGNPRYYYIGDRQGLRLDRSQDRYFELGQIAFRSDLRTDGKVALTDAFKKLTGVAH
jgi:HK97 family phage major capsid protein